MKEKNSNNARRYAGEGSIYVNGRGQYCAALDLGRSPITGKRRRRVVKAADRAGVVAKLKAAWRDVDNGKPGGDGRMTVEQWLTHWVENIVEPTRARHTYRNYRNIVVNHLAPLPIGRVKLAKLTPADVEATFQTLRDPEGAALGKGSIAQVKKVLTVALNVAGEPGRGLGVTYNAGRLAKVPPAGPYTIDDALDEDEVGAVLATAALPAPEGAFVPAIRAHELGALWALALTVGPRKSECIGLDWADVDFGNGWARIHGTKTEGSDRVIPLSPMVLEALKVHRKNQARRQVAAVQWIDKHAVFTDDEGRRLSDQNVHRAWFALLDEAGVARRRFHATRHTAATLMLNNGVPLEVVSKILGHSSYAITAKIYAKVRPPLTRDAADTIDAAYAKAIAERSRKAANG